MAEHGRITYFSLDTPGGALTDISNQLFSVGGLPGKTDRPDTTAFGDRAMKRSIVGLRDGGPISIGGFLQRVAGTRLHGRQVRVMTDEYAFEGDFTRLRLGRSIDLPDSETFGDDWKEREVIGLMDSTLGLTGQFNSAANKSDAQFRTYLASATAPLFSIAPEGFTIGNLVDLVQAQQGDYVVGSELNGIVPVDGNFMGHDQSDLGHSLHAHTAEAGIGNFTSVDLTTVSTTTGYAAHLHVTAYSGGGSATIKVQDSADDAAWADIITFAAVTLVTKERVVSNTATVRRYVRAALTAFTGTSITFVVAFARRDDTFGTAGTYMHFARLYGKTASASFEHGPESNTTGKRKHSGECRLQSLDVEYAHADRQTFTASLVVSGAVTFGTF